MSRYLPLGTADIPALTPAEAGIRFSDPGRMQGIVDLGTTVSVQPVPRLRIAAAVLTEQWVVHSKKLAYLLCVVRPKKWPNSSYSQTVQ